MDGNHNRLSDLREQVRVIVLDLYPEAQRVSVVVTLPDDEPAVLPVPLTRPAPSPSRG